MMFGIILGSIASGQLITKLGVYYPYSIVGTGIGCVGFGLLYLITVDMPYAELAVFIAIVGLGVGLNIQTLLLITQLSVENHEMAIATSTVAFVRTMGGVLGVAVFGAILNTGLKNNLSEQLSELATAGHATFSTLPAAQLSQLLTGYCDALQLVFISAVPVLGLGFLLSFFIKNQKMQRKVESQEQVAEDAEQAAGTAFEM